MHVQTPTLSLSHHGLSLQPFQVASSPVSHHSVVLRDDGACTDQPKSAILRSPYIKQAHNIRHMHKMACTVIMYVL